jgi:hypothetical protein
MKCWLCFNIQRRKPIGSWVLLFSGLGNTMKEFLGWRTFGGSEKDS